GVLLYKGRVTGGVVLAAFGCFGIFLGFYESAVGLMFAFFRSQDSFGMATNVTVDGALSAIGDRLGYKK
ncbi:hypothetical protein ACED91_04415, partial [Staphylococcus chromogenes]